MFWKYNTMSTSQMETLMDKEDVSLIDVLEEEDVIQECKIQNKKLIEFLTKPEVLAELINLIISEPPRDAEESTRFRLPHVAAEILSCEVPTLNNAISTDETLLDKLYSFMELDAPLNPLLASFFSKAFGGLITRKTEQNWYDFQFTCVQVIDFLKKKDFVSHALRHVGTSAITDLVLRLITCADSGDIKTSILEWLNEKELVQSIIKLIDVNFDRDTHDNAARLVIEILRVARDGQYVPANDRCDDPLLNTLENAETVDLLLSIIFGKKESSDDSAAIPPDSVISNGISIILALLETRAAVTSYNNMDNNMDNVYGGNFCGQSAANNDEISPEDAARQEAILTATLNSILPWLDSFTRLLINPPNQTPMRTTAGLLDPPLGQTRLCVAKLICTLLSTNNRDINMKLKELGTVNILLNLFFKYSLNNFLHAQVEECIRLVFAWNNNSLNQVETSKSPTSIRVRTPPTVEMVDSSCKDDADEESENNNAAEDDAVTNIDEKEILAGETTLKDPQQPDEDEAKADKPPTDEVVDPQYDNPILIDLYTNYCLVGRVLDAWEENETEEMRPGFHRKGYMGHLTRIANIMRDYMTTNSKCHALLEEQFAMMPEEMREKWEKFISGKLADTNERNTIIPASSYNTKMSSSEDDDSDFRDIPFPQESNIQQMFSDYQMQQMSENFIDSFGFTENEFHDEDEDSSDEMRRLANVLPDEGVTSPTSANKRAQDMFETACEQRFTSFPGGLEDDIDSDDNAGMNEDDEDPWADRTKEINFSTSASKSPEKILTTAAAENTVSSCAPTVDDKTSSDEEESAEVAKADSTASDESKAKKAKSSNDSNKMEVDEEDDATVDPLSELNHRGSEVVEAAAGSAAMDTGNPWDSKPLAASTSAPFENPFGSPLAPKAEGWANFTNSIKDEDSEMSPVKTSGRFDVSAVENTSSASPTTSLSPAKESPVSTPQNTLEEPPAVPM